MNIAFHSNQLGIRGTEVALYDYALGNEEILNNKSIIISDKNSNLETLSKFKDKFKVYLYEDFHKEVPYILDKEKIDNTYYIKYGFNDNKITDNTRNIIHTVFPCCDPHGDVYGYVSEWLSSLYNFKYPYIPHMVNLPNHNFKKFEFKDKLVIGWYGGDTFDIEFVKLAITNVAKKRKDLIFLFMNQLSFSNEENIIFTKSSYNLDEKVAFINSCDVMIHARERGETFGLSIAEFSSKNKPIITYCLSPEQSHISILKDKGLYYSNYDELYNLLLNITINDIQGKDWNCYREFTPKNIMEQFNNKFLTY